MCLSPEKDNAGPAVLKTIRDQWIEIMVDFKDEARPATVRKMIRCWSE